MAGSYDAGLARAKYELDDSQFSAAIQRAIASYGRLRQAQQEALTRVSLPAQATNTAASTAAEIKLQQAIARTAEAEARRANATARKTEFDARAARATAQAALAEQKLQTEAARTAAANDRAAQSALRREQAEARARGLGTAGGLPVLPRSLERFGTEAIGQIQTGLLGIVGPAAVATSAIAGVTKVVQEFGEAFTFKAELDANKRAIEVQLGGLRDSGTVFQQAGAFAHRYALTQQETNEAIRASIGILRQSKASTEDVLSTLLRLQQLSPEQGLQGAALALRELSSGDTQSLVERFEVSRAAANKMKAEIQGGADAVQVLSVFLEKSGIGMDALKTRTEGAAGKMNELKVAEEDLKLAEAKFAEGPGLAFLEQKTRVLTGLTRILTGDFDALRQSIINTMADGGNETEAFIKNLNELQERFRNLDPEKGAVLAATREQIVGIAAVSPDATHEMQALAGAFAVGDISADQFRTVLNATAESQRLTAQATAEAAAGMDAQAQAISRNSQQFASRSQLLALHTQATQAAIEKERALADEIEKDAAKSAVAATNSEVLAIAKAELTKQAQLAANALIAAGNAGPEMAARLAASSSGVDVLTAALLRLFNAKQSAIKGDLEQQTARQLTGVQGTQAEIENFKRSLAKDTRDARVKAAADAAAAERTYQAQLGNTAPTLQHLHAELNAIGKTQGTTSAAYIKKLQEINSLETQNVASARAQLESEAQLAQAKGNTARAIALLRQEQAQFAKGSTEFNNLEARILGLQKPKGGAGGKGLGALDRTDIQLAGDYQAQLDGVNARLAKGNLTQLQRNQLLVKQQDLEQKIADEKERQNKAALDAQLDIVRDAQKRLAEAREEAAARRAINSASTSQEQKQAAALRLQEISLEQQQRALDIAKEQREAGGTIPQAPQAIARPTVGSTPTLAGIPQIAPGVPIPFVPPSAIAAPPPITVNISITVTADGRVIQTKADPGVTLNLLRGLGLNGAPSLGGT